MGHFLKMDIFRIRAFNFAWIGLIFWYMVALRGRKKVTKRFFDFSFFAEIWAIWSKKCATAACFGAFFGPNRLYLGKKNEKSKNLSITFFLPLRATTCQKIGPIGPKLTEEIRKRYILRKWPIKSKHLKKSHFRSVSEVENFGETKIFS